MITTSPVDDVAQHAAVGEISTIHSAITTKHPNIRSWLKWRNARNRTAHGLDRMVIHFTPTSSSWMNLVERFFRGLTEDAIRYESFTGVAELIRGHQLLSRRHRDPQDDRERPRRHASSRRHFAGSL